jgi:hypothetical protein
MELLALIHDNRGNENVEIFVVTARAIWTRQNTGIHGGQFSHPMLVAHKARTALNAFKEANVISHESETGSSNQGVKWWNPPPRKYLNWDVAISTTTKMVGVGVVVRDDEGRVTLAKGKSNLLCTTQLLVKPWQHLWQLIFVRTWVFLM